MSVERFDVNDLVSRTGMPREHVVLVIKERYLHAIRSYFSAYFGNLNKKIHDLSEDDLFAEAEFVKRVFNIEEIRESIKPLG